MKMIKLTLTCMCLLLCHRESQGSTILLSTLGSNPSSSDPMSFWELPYASHDGALWQPFQTGSLSSTVYSVTIGSLQRTAPGSPPTVVIVNSNASGDPHLIQGLFNPVSTVSTTLGDYVFNAQNPSGTTLTANTNYWLGLADQYNDGSSYLWAHASASSTTGTGGFSINGFPRFQSGQNTTATTPFLFSLQGDVVPEPSRMLLLGLAGVFFALRRRRVA